MIVTEGKKRVRLSKSQRKARGPVKLVETPCHVRIGTKEDLFDILALAKLVHEEIGLFDFNETKVAEAIWPPLNQTGGIVGVIGDKGKLEGGIVLRIANYWYSDKQFLEEMCVFVHPDYRNAKDSRIQKLITFTKKVAHDLDLPLTIGVLSNSRTNAKIDLYRRNFGDPVGAFFLWGAKTGSDADSEE
jgi:hypothetical protein